MLPNSRTPVFIEIVHLHLLHKKNVLFNKNETMKKIFYLLLFISSLSIAQSEETIEHLPANEYFILNETAVLFENNFIINKYIAPNEKRGGLNKESGTFTDLSNKEYYFTVLGKKIRFKITTDCNSLIVGYFHTDSLKANKDLYRIENLEIKILKNNKTIINWTLVTKSKKYNERNVLYDGRDYFQKGYVPYEDSLINGDKLVILLVSV